MATKGDIPAKSYTGEQYFHQHKNFSHKPGANHLLEKHLQVDYLLQN